MSENEEWRPVVGYEGLYEVSSLGRVRSLDREVRHRCGGKALKRGKALMPECMTTGYYGVTLSSGGRGVKRTIHSLVLEAFSGPRPDSGMQARHRNGNRLDNRAENLVWGTRKENAQDRYLHGTMHRPGGRRCKLTESQVMEIRCSRETNKALSSRYGVTTDSIKNIRSGRTWRRLHGKEAPSCKTLSLQS